MMNKDRALSHLREALGLKPLTRPWAKAEILLGLLAAGLGEWMIKQAGQSSWPQAAAGLMLFVLGGYLALAGHRSHLYQSNDELAAYLAYEIRSARESPH